MTTSTAYVPAIPEGRVDKIIQLVATSTESWEHAAQNAITEAASSIRDLQTATVVESDLTLVGTTPTFRIKLQISFQLDRNRISQNGLPLKVRRYLIIANQTLASPGLGQLIETLLTRCEAEFHVVVPHATSTAVFTDPTSGALVVPHQAATNDASERDAQRRLDSFVDTYQPLTTHITGEIVAGDPLTATRRVATRTSFDEIIISTQPAGISRWLKLDLPHRIERTFDVPVTTLVQEPSK